MPVAVSGRMKVLQERQKTLAAEGRKLAEIAADQRTDEQKARLAAITGDGGDLDRVVGEIEAEKKLIAAERAEILDVTDLAAAKPWASFGEQLMAIAHAGMPGGRIDPRLYAGPSGASTQSGADGGFLIAKDRSLALLEGGIAEAVLAPRCFRIPIGENSDGVEAPMIDETSRANGSRWGGVRIYRKAEADAVTATKPKFGLFDLRLEDLMGLAYATDRLLQDAVALERIFTQAFTEEFAFKIDDEIVRGSGVGECLGLLNAGATVSVPKETNQAAATVVTSNLSKMWARMPARFKRGAAWFMNVDVEPQLDELATPVGTGGIPCPFVRWSGDGTSLTIKGRPVLPIEQCESLGTVGDLILADLGQYVLIDKGGLQSDVSIHVRFIYNERTFRWVSRINGRPKWNSALTPYKGTGNTQSPFITLATRA